jgi:hypothetical protein
MAKYTQNQLKEMAEDVLCAYNLQDQRADMLIQFLAQITGANPQLIFNEIIKMADMPVER